MALFNKQKQEKKKKGENVIGKIIYGFLLFAPLFNILVTCMYVTFNKNAYESYSGINGYQINYKFETNEVNSANDLVYGRIYHYSRPRNTITEGTRFANAKEIYNYEYKGVNIATESLTANYLELYCPNSTAIYIYRSDSILLYQSQNTNTTIEYDVVFNNLRNEDNYSYYSASTFNYIDNVEISNVGTLDNAFIYGTIKTEESDLFNWAKETGTYTVLNNVTTQIGITNTFIPMLMAYWLLISVVYFLFDIALILVWMVHDKIHDLKDAI